MVEDLNAVAAGGAVTCPRGAVDVAGGAVFAFLLLVQEERGALTLKELEDGSTRDDAWVCAGGEIEEEGGGGD